MVKKNSSTNKPIKLELLLESEVVAAVLRKANKDGLDWERQEKYLDYPKRNADRIAIERCIEHKIRGWVRDNNYFR